MGTNGELIRWSFERLNARDLQTLRRFWSAETVARFPQGAYRGTDAIAAYFAEALASLPDWHMEIVALVEQGDDVFVHWHLTGTHSGSPFQGIAPSGRAIALDGMDHVVMRDGVVVTTFVVYDQMQFARQIGMMPQDGSRGDRAVKAAFNAKSRLLGRLRRR
ncbi:MAG: ester cyclase [Solirubrobacteraceae bacterium]